MDGRKLRKERERLGESQDEFAKRFGVDQATISRWENNAVPPRGSSLKLIQIVLSGLRLADIKQNNALPQDVHLRR